MIDTSYQSKLLAFGVTHLTDARYFAAMGADWLFFDGNVSVLKLQEYYSMIEWLQGPNFGIYFQEVPSEQIILDIEQNGFRGLALPYKELEKAELSTKLELFGIGDGKNVMNNILMDSIPTLRESHFYWIDAKLVDERTLESYKSVVNVGLVVRGGEESGTGIRDFDDIEIILEKWLN